MSYTVRRMRIESSEQLDALALACGSLYSQTVTWFWRTVKHQGVWLKPSSMMRWLNSDQMHAHTADATVQAFYSSLDSWRARRKIDPNAKPPRRRRKFFRVEYKSTAIRHRNGQLILSNGRNLPPTILAWQWDTPKTIVIRWRETGGYEAIATYRITKVKPIETGRVAGVDLGEIHMAVVHDGEQCTIFNGRLLRSKRQYQNKLKAKLSAVIDRKAKGSKRRKRMIRSKRKQLTKLKNQIRDIEHKMSTKLVSTLVERRVQTVVIGDVRDIRQDLDYGKKANQKLHQWSSGKMRFYITYKSERTGMEVKLQEERYTSQECPQCSHRYKPSGRVYHCRKCGFRYHRDGVGGWNIRKKYLKPTVSIVGFMAQPTGVRFTPHLRVARAALICLRSRTALAVAECHLVVQAINDAHSSIRLVGYSFTSVPIAKALIAKHKDGCDIQVVLDKSNATENYSAATLLFNAGIPVRIDSKHAITHDKYMVIDGAEVETGSFNYTAAAEKSNAENVLVIRNQPALATKYLANWQVLWSESKPYQGIGK